MIDRIEREVLIEAPVERVWALASEPGWWIGDGDRSRQTITERGGLTVVDDPRYGRYLVLVVATEAPRYVSFRSVADDGTLPAEETSTLVEFHVTATDGGTLLRVVESGFGALGSSADVVEDNIKGWEFQLAVAQRESGRG